VCNSASGEYPTSTEVGRAEIAIFKQLNKAGSSALKPNMGVLGADNRWYPDAIVIDCWAGYTRTDGITVNVSQDAKEPTRKAGSALQSILNFLLDDNAKMNRDAGLMPTLLVDGMIDVHIEVHPALPTPRNKSNE